MITSPSLRREFIFGSYVYQYELHKQDRKSLSLTVDPDLRIIVKCPKKASDERIEQFLRKKWYWLEKQLSYFSKFKRKEYVREYVSGESLYYLGKQYRLAVKVGPSNKVSLLRGILVVHTTRTVTSHAHTKKLVEGWYAEKRLQIFEERFNAILDRFDYNKAPKFSIRDMRRRWGSCVAVDRIVLNPKLIQLPKECIDYVITHELCHVKYKSHNKNFQTLMNQKFPKWEKTKEKLEFRGAFAN